MGRKQNSRNHGFWFWVARNGWYHTCPTTGKRISLKVKGKENKALAQQRYCQIQASGGIPGLQAAAKRQAITTVEQLVEAFLDARKSKACHKAYTSNLKAFRTAHGPLAPSAITKDQITGWLDNQTTWDYSTKVGVKKVLKALFNFAVSEGLFSVSPIRALVTGQTRSRKATFSPDQLKVIEKHLEATDPAFCNLFLAMAKCWCRPDELFRLTAVDIQDHGTYLVGILEEWKNGEKCNEPRTIYFTNGMVARVRSLIAQFPQGPLFRTQTGKSWNGNLTTIAMKKLREACGLSGELKLYSGRHTCITEAIRSGVKIQQLCKAAGTSAVMIEKNYGHLIHKDVIDALGTMGDAA